MIGIRPPHRIRVVLPRALHSPRISLSPAINTSGSPPESHPESKAIRKSLPTHPHLEQRRAAEIPALACTGPRHFPGFRYFNRVRTHEGRARATASATRVAALRFDPAYDLGPSASTGQARLRRPRVLNPKHHASFRALLVAGATGRCPAPPIPSIPISLLRANIPALPLRIPPPAPRRLDESHLEYDPRRLKRRTSIASFVCTTGGSGSIQIRCACGGVRLTCVCSGLTASSLEFLNLRRHTLQLSAQGLLR
ncbi:hypothetical protein B0H16DRAFT_1706189 [Mycena metata]|uniref:Uncharacterized protein n=1 Tax=Mycena metata TaxID=1033252 RepID=A0AAD7GJ74_9AGAR|nr:hypothetical protein B0H16DRAFT_1706189 [Mycena metata]